MLLYCFSKHFWKTWQPLARICNILIWKWQDITFFFFSFLWVVYLFVGAQVTNCCENQWWEVGKMHIRIVCQNVTNVTQSQQFKRCKVKLRQWIYWTQYRNVGAVIAWKVKCALIKSRIYSVNRHFEYKKEMVAHSDSFFK